MVSLGGCSHVWQCSLSLSISSCCIFHPHSPFSRYGDSKCHWFLSSKSPKALIWTLQKKKKIISHFKSYSTTQNTPVGALPTIYDLYHNYKSKVSLGKKCQLGLKEFKSFFSLSGLRIDGERVNGNDSFKRFLMSFFNSWVLGCFHT